jgi:hypothetical protein
MRHGKGICHWPDGHRYSGEFRQNEFHGRGEYRWADGKFYDGEWINSNNFFIN